MDVSAEPTLEDVFGLDLHSLRALAHLVPDLRAVVANVVLRVVFGQLFEKLLGPLEVLLDEDFGVVVSALGPLLAVPVHVIPAELTHYVFELAHLALETEAHVEVGAALVDMPVGAMLSFLALLLHKLRTNLQVVAEVALVPVAALPHTLELVAWFDLALVVRVRTVIGESAFTVDEFLADAVGGEFVVVGGGCGLLLDVGGPLVEIVVIAGQ